MTGAELFVGVDVGTSGVRAMAIDRDGDVSGHSQVAMPAPDRDGAKAFQDPEIWWRAAAEALKQLAAQCPAGAIRALAIDGTSGTLLLTDAEGRPLGPGLMYNDARSAAEAARVAAIAPPESGGHGASAALAKLLHLQGGSAAAWHALHQADWLAARLTGHYGISDENNALKLGYDVVNRRWPDWFAALGVRGDLLPEVVPPGTVIGTIAPAMATALGLPAGIELVSGTTDGVAAFLATGADAIGDGVTSLGSTLVVKLLSDRPLFAPELGVYSHRLGELWLPGGASNTGGGALLRFFTSDGMAALAPLLDPDRPTGLDYYPLPAPGERFPVNDPAKPPRTEPRPEDDAAFFQGLLEGIAAVERDAYRCLENLGGPRLRCLRTVGGGAGNQAWTRIRARLLGVPMREPVSTEAAYGAALLARRGFAARA